MVKDLADARPARRAYLVLHDYGMGGLWWWIRASLAEEITAAFAEVEVVGDPEAIALARTWDLDVLDIELDAAFLAPGAVISTSPEQLRAWGADCATCPGRPRSEALTIRDRRGPQPSAPEQSQG